MLQIDAHDGLSRFAVIERIGGLSFQTSPSPAPPSLYPLPLSLPYYLPLSCCRWALGGGGWGLGAGGWWFGFGFRFSSGRGQVPGPPGPETIPSPEEPGGPGPGAACSEPEAPGFGLRAVLCM
jgi:hypothetical protein